MFLLILFSFPACSLESAKRKIWDGTYASADLDGGVSQ